MTTKKLITAALVGLMTTSLTTAALAESPKMKMTTPIPAEITMPDRVETRLGTLNFTNGMPDRATIETVYDFIDFARAVEVYLNTLPGVSMWSIRKGAREVGQKDNTMMTMERLMDSTGMYLTPNTVTPQTWLSLNLKDGPMVLETPPNIIGLADDMWFRYISDIGMLGPDKNKGGKFLFLPPGYEGEVPEGYFVIKSPTYGVWTPWRNIAVNGEIQPALDNIRKHVRIYPLSEAGKKHAEVQNLNGSFKQTNTIPPSNDLFWEYLNNLVQEEPAGSAGVEITGQMASIGIVKGKPFKPDARMKKILSEAVAVGNATARAITFEPRDESAYFYGKESAWFTPFQGGYDFESNGARNLDGRVAYHYFATGITPAMEAKTVGAGSQYATAAKDSKGNWFDGSKNYKLTLPANIPQKNFWSITVYDSQTRGLLQNDLPYPTVGAGSGFPASGNQNGAVQQNKDGSTDLYFGPKAPEGKKSNWVQTVSGKGWFVLLRMYSPLEAWFDKTWKPGEFELVK